MSRTISVFVRIDRSAGTVTLAVTGCLSPGDQQELTRMTERARILFPDAVVTVDLSSARAPKPQEPQEPQDLQGQQDENTNHRGDGQPEISSTPIAPPLMTALSTV